MKLRVSHIPQVPMKPFFVPVNDIKEAKKVMDTVGQSDLLNFKGQYIRIAYKGIGNPVEIIGNIIQDKWFNYKSML